MDTSDDDNLIRSNSSLSSNGINEIENAVVDANEGASNNEDDDEDEDEDDSMIVTEDANNDDDTDDEYKPNNRNKANKEDPRRAIYDQLIEQFTRCKTDGQHINVRTKRGTAISITTTITIITIITIITTLLSLLSLLSLS